MNLKKTIRYFFRENNFKFVVVSKKDVDHLSKNLSSFYDQITESLKKKSKNSLNEEIIIRRSIVPLTYIFFERLIRSIYFYKKRKKSNIKNFYTFNQIETLEQFENYVSYSDKFNYSLLNNFVAILERKKI